jgi:hypothetical protein
MSDEQYMKAVDSGTLPRLTRKENAVIWWITILLIINTVDFVSYTSVQILIAVDIFKGQVSQVYEVWTFVCLFWIDILCLTNGMCFLLLFK